MNDWVEYLRLVDAGVDQKTASTLVLERRRRLPAGRPRAAREHGSERGWQQHRTDGTAACDPCRAAHYRHHLQGATS